MTSLSSSRAWHSTNHKQRAYKDSGTFRPERLFLIRIIVLRILAHVSEYK